MRNSYASYPVQLPVRYQTQGEDPVTGTGQTLAISRETLRFLCDRPLPRNRKIQIILAWPATLPDGASLNLWIVGTIAGCVARCVEVRLGRYEFRTRGDARPTNAVLATNGAGFRSLTAGS